MAGGMLAEAVGGLGSGARGGLWLVAAIAFLLQLSELLLEMDGPSRSRSAPHPSSSLSSRSNSGVTG